MAAFPGGMMDAATTQSSPLFEVQSVTTQQQIYPCSGRPPITVHNFMPTPIPPPRAWQRVAVPSASHARQRKIWKRVGGFPTNAHEPRYISAMTELDSQGDIPRKRARPARYVPVFGDARWDLRFKEPRDGKQDLIEARVSVSAAIEAAATSAPGATLTDNTQTSIPRKRHNSRWPIEPKTTPPRQIADLQPLIEFQVPSTVEPVEMAEQVDEKKMRRRSTRRLSRRISLGPGGDSPRKLGTISLSPTKASAPMLSPMKRPPGTLSPTKVAESPRRLFKVDVPSKRLVLESPKASLPAISPCKSSPVSSAPEILSSDLSLSEKDLSHSSDASPLLFDQPIPTIQIEPQYETRRRISLQSARRSDRRSSGVLRLVDFETVREAPNRRHSFAFADSVPSNVKSRRNTLDTFCDMPDEARAVATEETHTNDETVNVQEQSSETAPAPLPAYEVDAGTNLDIFGQVQQQKAAKPATMVSVPTHEPTSEPIPAQDNRAPVEVMQPCSSPMQNSREDGSASSLLLIGVTGGADGEEAGMDQAATTPNPDADDADDANCPDIISLDPPLSSTVVEDLPSTDPERAESAFEFGPHDPEGLSTIYEEESMMDGPSSQLTACETAQATSSPDSVSSQETAVDENKLDTCASSSQTETNGADQPQCDQLVEDGPASQNHQGSTGYRKPADETVMEFSVNHTVAVDVLSTSDSPDKSPETPATELSTAMQGNGSPNTSEVSIATPKNDICGMVSLDAPAKSDAMGMGEMIASEPQTTSIPVQAPISDTLDQDATSTPERPVTPAKTNEVQTSKDAMAVEDQVNSFESPKSDSSGFTPINGRQISPTSPSLATVAADTEEVEVETDDFDEEVDEDLMDLDDETTAAVDEDFTLSVVAPRPENDTLSLHALHDDAEFVRDFVSRVTAGRNAKAAAAAAAVDPPRKVGRPKRRSGSTGSNATSTGSPVPVSKSDTPKRTPLGEKSLNSPSPLKKRKLEEEGEDIAKDKEDASNIPEGGPDAPKLKRRRKRADPILEDSVDSPTEPDDSTSGPRRSTRTRSTRITLKSAPSANSIAMSMYQGRLAGGVAGMMDDSIMDSHLIVSRHRSETKELEAVTRGNTRANKAGAVLPRVVLERLAKDPAAWRMRELKDVFSAKETRAAKEDGADKDEKKSKKAKGVRWAEELARYQTDDSSSTRVFKTMAKSLLADVMNGDGSEDDEDELAMPTLSTVPATEKSRSSDKSLPAPTPAKKQAAPVRRTRSSKLQAPTPVKKLAAASDKKASSVSPVGAAAPARATSSSSSKPAAGKKTLPTPTATATAATKKAAASSTTRPGGMATRRTKIASLGMGVNGTPAPKRRGRTAA